MRSKRGRVLEPLLQQGTGKISVVSRECPLTLISEDLRLDYFDAPAKAIRLQGLFDTGVADDDEVVSLETQRRDKDLLAVDSTPLAQRARLPRSEIPEEHSCRARTPSVSDMSIVADANIVCAGQRINQEGSSPSGALMGSTISKSGGNASLAGEDR